MGQEQSVSRAWSIGSLGPVFLEFVTHTHTHIHRHVHICRDTHRYPPTHVLSHICRHTHVYADTDIHGTHIPLYIDTQAHTHTHSCAYVMQPQSGSLYSNAQGS